MSALLHFIAANHVRIGRQRRAVFVIEGRILKRMQHCVARDQKAKRLNGTDGSMPNQCHPLRGCNGEQRVPLAKMCNRTHLAVLLKQKSDDNLNQA